MATIGVHPIADGATSYSVNGQQMVTEREAVERERAAYVRGVVDRARMQHDDTRQDPMVYPSGHAPMASCDAVALLYPLPKVTRPRVETDQYGDEWKYEPPGDGVVDGTFYWRSAFNPNGAWDRVEKAETQVIPTLARLLAQPTEEVTP